MMKIPAPFFSTNTVSLGIPWAGPLLAALVFATDTSMASETRLLSLTQFDTFQRAPGSAPNETVLTSPELGPGISWKSLVVSWNAATNVILQVEARPLPPGDSRFYSFGQWAALPGPETPRHSVNGQKDDRGTLSTDTLDLHQTAERVQIRITLRGPESGLKRVSLAFSGPDANPAPTGIPPAPNPVDLEVPARSQAEFPEGIDKWCSPTSTSMLMAYWAEQKHRPDWQHSVPDTARAVFDPVYKGTGNWVFNMAFAGGHDGLNAAVARFPSLLELQQWTASGAPAAASVSNSLLKGKPAPTPGDGHLVVVRGFTAEGDLIINDPGVRLDRVRRVVPRATFERAWKHSEQTVYLIWPDGHALPEGPAFPR